jgi:hypothetical protein
MHAVGRNTNTNEISPHSDDRDGKIPKNSIAGGLTAAPKSSNIGE